MRDAPDISVILKDHSIYQAHIHNSKPAESLYEHITLVNQYANVLVKAHNLDNIIDRIILDYVETWNGNKIIAGELLKLFFTHAIVFHDFGKVNPAFQELRMKNTINVTYRPVPALKPVHGHSLLSTFLFLCYHIQLVFEQKISDREKQLLMCHCFFLAYPIIQHHSPLLGNVIEEGGYMCRFEEMVDQLEQFTLLYGFEPDKKMLTGVLKNSIKIWKSLQQNGEKKTANSLSLFVLLKLGFSLLTAADYLATHEYMNSTSNSHEAATSDLGILESTSRIQEITLHLQQFKHNAATFANIDEYLFQHPTEKSPANLNRLRQEMAVELIQTIRKNLSAKLFYIEAPTGAGKTNLSAIAFTELLSANPEINKVFYVFPFTTLITQTIVVLKDSLGLQDHEIIELHSKAGFQSKNFQYEQTKDGLYGKEKKDFIDHLFALYPITLLSHIKFFDILKSNYKESNYLLHRLTNSIVIIDEIQSYNPSLWDKMLYFINQYAHLLNIRFILMSATLPKISELNIGLIQRPHFIDLLPNARRYMTNSNFSERVKFNFSLHGRKIELIELASVVMEKSARYAEEKGSVLTIIEFIYKQSASDFQQLISTQNALFDNIFVLSGTILEPRRREIIHFIKRSANKKINILLITTQVIEAGVDIDMDIGFKNTSLIDSDEQLAGRVNRNASKGTCEVYLFQLDDAKILYGSDFRFKKTMENISPTQHQDILRTKNFKELYEKVLYHIDHLNSLHLSDNFSNYESDIQELKFRNVDAHFKIIDQQNQTVFVPLSIPIYVDTPETGEKEAIFSKNDWQLLNSFDVYEEENTLNGEKVWHIYEMIIEQQVSEKKGKAPYDLNNNIRLKTLQNIMSKFCFSLLAYSKDYQRLLTCFGELKYGYLYFSYWNEERENEIPYNYETGLNSHAFSDANFI